MQTITPEALLEKTNGTIVDIREVDEYASGHVKGAINVPLSQIQTRRQEIPDGAYLICQTGARSAMATEYLTALGQSVVDVLGGVSAWPKALEV